METNANPWTDNKDWAEKCDELRKQIIYKALKHAEHSTTANAPDKAQHYLEVVRMATETPSFDALLAVASR